MSKRLLASTAALWLALLALSIALSTLASIHDTLPGDTGTASWLQGLSFPGESLADTVRSITSTQLLLAAGGALALLLWLRGYRLEAQVFAAAHEHERIFGSKPRGMWVPECAYYPGLDDVLAEAGIRYFLVDSHGMENADPRPAFDVNAPVYCPSGVAAFGRHPTTSKLVWSSRVGYPADYNYREYYRDISYELDDE
ncbi:hypothetical protein LCGC14_2348660, partial [marine sediment metagenome]